MGDGDVDTVKNPDCGFSFIDIKVLRTKEAGSNIRFLSFIDIKVLRTKEAGSNIRFLSFIDIKVLRTKENVDNFLFHSLKSYGLKKPGVISDFFL